MVFVFDGHRLTVLRVFCRLFELKVVLALELPEQLMKSLEFLPVLNVQSFLLEV